MSAPLSRKATVAISVISMLLFALASAAVPQMVWIIFILYFVVLMVIMGRGAAKAIKRPPPAKELGSPLYKEVNVMQALVQDKELNAELRSQASFLLLNTVFIFFLIFVLIPLYQGNIAPYIESAVASLTDSEFARRFLVYLGMYVFFIGVSQGSRFILFRKPPAQVTFPRKSFYVYKKGIVIDEAQFIPFNGELCFRAEPERKFIEVRAGPRAPPVRLYTLEVAKLKEVLKGVGINECG